MKRLANLLREVAEWLDPQPFENLSHHGVTPYPVVRDDDEDFPVHGENPL